MILQPAARPTLRRGRAARQAPGRGPPHRQLHNGRRRGLRPPRPAGWGRFLLCQRPEQLAEVLSTLRAARLEPKRLAFVKNRPDAAPWLFLVEAQKGRKTGLRVEPDVLITSGAALYGPRE